MTTCKLGAGGRNQEADEQGRYSGPLCEGDLPTPSPKKRPPVWHSTQEMPFLVKAREDYLKNINRDQWEEFSRAIDKLPGGTENEKFRYRMIFGVEGMMKVDKRSGTTSGIQPATYRSNVKEGFFSPDPGHTVNEPKDLNIEERARYYRAFFEEKLERFGGYSALNAMGDKETAAAVADVVFQYSPKGADTVFRKALGDMDAQYPEENKLCDNTWNELLAKAEDPNERLELRKNIARAREKFAPGPENRGDPFFGQDRYKMFVYYYQ